MAHKLKKPMKRANGSQGFSLIATVTMMILLSLIAIGILSLSTATVRSAGASAEIQEARANARLALSMAIGRLQKLSGSDRAITAPAGMGILGESSLRIGSTSPGLSLRNYIGVWESARTPRDEKNKFFFSEPEYPNEGRLSNDNLFKGWLVSNADLDDVNSQSFFDNANSTDAINFAAGGGGSSKGSTAPVYLVHTGSVENESDFIKAGRVPIQTRGANSETESGGSYAYWIGDNNQKFFLNPSDEKLRPDEERSPDIEKANGGDHYAKMATPGPYGLESFSYLDPQDGGFSIDANTGETDGLLTLQSLEFGQDESVARRNFHDVTTLADSLIVDVTRGGLRKDLSLFFEGEPTSGDWTGYRIKSGAPLGPYGQEALSNHDEYDTGSWSLLRQYAKMGDAGRLIRSSKGSGNRVLVADSRAQKSLQDPEYPGWNRQRMTFNPVIVRASMILAVGATDINTMPAGQFRKPIVDNIFPSNFNNVRPVKDPNSTDANPRFIRNNYLLNFSAYPVVTLWNPYNVPMEVPGFSMMMLGTGTQQIIRVNDENPVAFHWGIQNEKDGVTTSRGASRGIYYERSFTLDPGETRTFAADIKKTPYLSRALYFPAKPLRRPRDLEDLVTARAPWNGGFLFNAHDVTRNADHDNRDIYGDPNTAFSLMKSTSGIFANGSDKISIETVEFVPAGISNQDLSPNIPGHQGMQNYENYSSLDVSMYVSGDIDTSKLWFSYGRLNSTKYAAKVAWRMDEGNPVTVESDLGAGQSQIPPFNMSTITNGTRRPFMAVDLRLKSVESQIDQAANPNCNWLHNIPQSSYTGVTDHGVRKYTGSSVSESDIRTSAMAHPYTMKFVSTPNFTDFFTTVHPVERHDGHLVPFVGRSYSFAAGQRRMVAAEVPMGPLQSIAQLTHLPMRPIDASRWSNIAVQNMAIGNSYASPLLAADNIAFPTSHPSPPNSPSWGGWKTWLDLEQNKTGSSWQGSPDLDGFGWTPNHGKPDVENHFTPIRFIDRSYVANTLLWDDFFFSGMADYESRYFEKVGGTSRDKEQVIQEFVSGNLPLPNATYKVNKRGVQDSEIISQLEGIEGYEKAASYMKIAGGFNVNSLSAKAWKAFLSSNLRKKVTVTRDNGTAQSGESDFEVSEIDRYAISRYSAPIETTGDESTKWVEYNTIDEDQLNDLAEKIVGEVSARGPFRSISEFVNRRVERNRQNSEFAVKGALQAALDRSEVNAKFTKSNKVISAGQIGGTSYEFPEAAQQSQYAGTPEYVMQSDLLNSLGPAIQARGDCFIIRAFGESSNGEARAWCEAQVARSIDFLDPQNEPDEDFEELTETNQTFGRKYRVVSFRWLDASEV